MNNDLISRSALKKKAEMVILWNGDLRRFVSYETIDNAPTVPLPDFKEGYKQAIIDGKTNFSRPHGEWIKTPELFRDRICSHCGKQISYEQIGKFCIECGAEMRKETEK